MARKTLKSAISMMLVAGGLGAAVPARASAEEETKKPAAKTKSKTVVGPCNKNKGGVIGPCNKTKSKTVVGPCNKNKGGGIAPCAKTKAGATPTAGEKAPETAQ